MSRDDDGDLHAFANFCRRRGHELLSCGESARRPDVPYHSWTFALSGELRSAKGFGGTPGFDPGGWGLVELPVTDWHGLLFVNGSGAAGPMERALADLDELVAPYAPERLVVAGRRSSDAAANWKVLTENYHECYHCPVIHPELCLISPPGSGENYQTSGPWLGGWMRLRDGMETMSLDGVSLALPLPGLDPALHRTVNYLSIFPNVLLSLHPDYVMTHVLTPVAADRTLIDCSWAFAPEALGRPGFDPGYAVEFWDITNRQDWAACESVQRGLTSPHARPGPLSRTRTLSTSRAEPGRARLLRGCGLANQDQGRNSPAGVTIRRGSVAPAEVALPQLMHGLGELIVCASGLLAVTQRAIEMRARPLSPGPVAW